MPHYIVVEEEIDETGYPEWSIEHPDECPREYLHDGYTIFIGAGRVLYYNCAVGRIIDEAGLDAFGSFSAWPEDIPTAPGKYPIEAWVEKHYNPCYGPTEYDVGLCVVKRLLG